MKSATVASALLSLGLIGLPTAADAATTTFSNGAEGWQGNAEVDGTVGTPAPAFHSLVESFGLSWRNQTNPAFIGDFSDAGSLTIGLDVLTSSITYLGTEVTRGLFVKLMTFGPDGEEAPPVATVYYRLGTLSAAIDGWQHLSVTIDDTNAAALPTGWVGVDGDGVLQLPAGVTFADVLADVDQIEFTTYEPDYFYGFTVFDVAGDNFSVTPGAAAAVPEPASWATMIAGFGLVGGALRSRRRIAFAA
jgi:hypothetical protein